LSELRASFGTGEARADAYRASPRRWRQERERAETRTIRAVSASPGGSDIYFPTCILVRYHAGEPVERSKVRTRDIR
jgi:hypothetical protein